MTINWGYSPKVEKYIPLGDFSIDKYLIIAKQAVENLGWKLSHISSNGIIAYTPLSFQSYSEEVSIRIVGNFAIAKSECIGIQLLFNDYGKNSQNLDRFFHEFEYVEFHLKDHWEESIANFKTFVATQDEQFFEKAPLTAKDKIKNVLYLFYPQKGYTATPILIYLNLFYYGLVILIAILGILQLYQGPLKGLSSDWIYNMSVNKRDLVLQGQYWRLLTHQFIHFNLLHLFFNLYALVYIGLMVEHKIGAKKFIFIYLLSGVCGGLVSLIFHEEGVMGGASGAVMGMFGAFLALLLSNAFEKNATRALLISTVLVSAIMLLNGIRGRSDNSAHLGGLISGFVMAFVLFNEKFGSIRIKESWRYVLAFSLSAVFLILVLSLTPNYQVKELFKLEQVYNNNITIYMKVYSISDQLPASEKMRLVNENGINAWKKNKEVVKKMRSLTLNKADQKVVEFYDKIANKTLAFVEILYLECKEEKSQYKKQLDAKMIEINKIKAEANETNRYFY